MKKIAVRGVNSIHVRDGKIVETSGYVKSSEGSGSLKKMYFRQIVLNRNAVFLLNRSAGISHFGATQTVVDFFTNHEA